MPYLFSKISLKILKAMAGSVVVPDFEITLMEKSKSGTPMHGFTDNYVRVELPHDNSLDNQLLRVRMSDFNEDGTSLKGTII